MCFLVGEPEARLSFGQEAVERARRLGDDVLLGRRLMLYLTSIDPARSLPFYPEAFACAERSGDHLINYFLYNNSGCAALQMGTSPPPGSPGSRGSAGPPIGYQDPALMANLDWTLCAQRDPDGVRPLFETSLRDSQRNGDNDRLASAILGLACLAGNTADWYRAATLYGSAQAICDRAGMDWRGPEASSRQDSLDQARAHLGRSCCSSP